MACKTLHIGVFFDGTGNNKTLDSTTTSQSNIAKLSELYQTGTWKEDDKEHTSFMIYKNGVGTYDTEGERDKNVVDRKYEKGGGGGGAIRIYEALDEVKKYLEEHPSVRSANGMYAKRQIDVFGFSRGAAMARDFVNTFYSTNQFKSVERTVEINFIGVYDTVGSFGKAGDDVNAKPKENSGKREDDAHLLEILNGYFGMIDAVDFKKIDVADTKTQNELLEDGWIEDSKVKDENGKDVVKFKKFHEGFEEYNFNLDVTSGNKIVHMVANDEVRKNFPLSSIGSSGDEWSFGGVHSDIGGGYGLVEIEPHGYKVEGKYKTKELAQLQIIKEKREKPDWDFTYKEKYEYNPQTHQLEVDYYEIYGESMRWITNELTYITLHRMYEVAKESGVPWCNKIDINKKHKISDEPLIQEYNNHTKNNISSATNFPMIGDLKDEFYHHSAVDQEDIDTKYDGHTSLTDVWHKDSPDRGDGNHTRYEGEGKHRKAKREIYPNYPKKSIKPEKEGSNT